MGYRTKKRFWTIATIAAIGCAVLCEGCSTQRQLKLRGPFHSEYSQRPSESHDGVDGAEKMGYLKFLQVDIEP